MQCVMSYHNGKRVFPYCVQSIVRPDHLGITCVVDNTSTIIAFTTFFIATTFFTCVACVCVDYYICTGQSLYTFTVLRL